MPVKQVYLLLLKVIAMKAASPTFQWMATKI